MSLSDLLLRRSRHAKSAILAETWRHRASQLRRQAGQPASDDRRSILLAAAYEYDQLADRITDVANANRSRAVKVRAADRRRRERGKNFPRSGLVEGRTYENPLDAGMDRLDDGPDLRDRQLPN